MSYRVTLFDPHGNVCEERVFSPRSPSPNSDYLDKTDIREFVGDFVFNMSRDGLACSIEGEDE